MKGEEFVGKGEGYKHNGEESVKERVRPMEKQSFLCLCRTESTLVMFIN